MSENKFLNNDEAADLLRKRGDEYVTIQNPDYIHPEIEICQMAPKVFSVEGNIPAFVMDMDGTTTTTEELCIHSLEYMIRCLSGKMTRAQWSGLDATADYPHIIGNSTTKHVEYLIGKYKSMFLRKNISVSYISAAVHTLLNGHDIQRKEEVRANIIILIWKVFFLIESLPALPFKVRSL